MIDSLVCGQKTAEDMHHALLCTTTERLVAAKHGCDPNCADAMAAAMLWAVHNLWVSTAALCFKSLLPRLGEA